MEIRLFIKTLFILFVSYLFIRIIYDRLAFGYLDLRVFSLLELLIIPAGLTVLLWTACPIMKLRISSRKQKDRQI